jgi:hypothetical protein
MTSGADKILATLDGLGGDFPDVRDELELQGAGLLAAPARAHVELDEPTFRVERPVRATTEPVTTFSVSRPSIAVDVTREERCVALDLD